ncbi:heterokaryon incompatibility protein-domain-containing protein [Nemania sp. FL0916]|nr:heterokaryon incompatibility protein-domain-containing protein [Nemania sp. FL0916]
MSSPNTDEAKRQSFPASVRLLKCLVWHLVMAQLSFDDICSSCVSICEGIGKDSGFLNNTGRNIEQIVTSSENCCLCRMMISSLCNNANLAEAPSSPLKTAADEIVGLLYYKSNELTLLIQGVPSGIIRVIRQDTDIKGRPTHVDMTPQTCAQLLKVWVGSCEKGHQSRDNPVETVHECLSSWKPAGKRLPTRLLEITPGLATQAPTVRLVQSRSLPETTKYVTLSYRWGGDVPCKTTNELLEAYTKQVPFERLPKTIRDAILLVCELEIKYIWIDSLCIIQNNSDDWEEEAGRMATVYANGFLNIAADVAYDSNGGLYVSRNPLKFAACHYGSFALFRDEFEDAAFRSRPLYTRAWAHQERYLSARTVHFGYEQISWECASCNLMEGFPFEDTFPNRDGVPSILRKPPEKQSWSRMWENIIMPYSKMNLTHKSDKLVANSGLAFRFAGLVNACTPTLELHQSDYLAGLWKPYLPDHLLWYNKANKLGHYLYDEKYRAPSWSWVSLDCPVDFHHIPGSILPSYKLAIIESSVSPISLASCKKGHIRAKGLICPASSIFSLDELSLESALTRVVLDYDKQFGGGASSFYLDDRPNIQERVVDRRRVYTLPVYAYCAPKFTPKGRLPGDAWGVYGLLLERTPDDSRGQYSRLGTFELDAFGGALKWRRLVQYCKTVELDMTVYESRDIDGTCEIEIV